VLEPLSMTVSLFPIDADLPTLVGATDPGRMLEILREAFRTTNGRPFTPIQCRVEVAHYPRQHHCVLRYTLEGPRSSGGGSRADRLRKDRGRRSRRGGRRGRSGAPRAGPAGEGAAVHGPQVARIRRGVAADLAGGHTRCAANLPALPGAPPERARGERHPHPGRCNRLGSAGCGGSAQLGHRARTQPASKTSGSSCSKRALPSNGCRPASPPGSTSGSKWPLHAPQCRSRGLRASATGTSAHRS